MAAREERILPALPDVAPLFVRALAATGRRGRAPALPAASVVVADHAQDAARLAAYDRLCGFALRDAVPATWLHVLTFPLQVALMAERDFPFPLAGLVHVANDLTLVRPVGVGERLRLSVRADRLASHRRGITFDLVGEARVGAERVWEGRSTYLARRPATPAGPDAAGPDAAAPDAAAPDPAREAADEAPDTAREAGDDRDRTPPPAQRWRLPADLGRRYAAVSGDVNPLHLHSAAARLFGFRRPIAHGMWLHARALAALGGRLPPAHTATVSFTKPVLLPGTVLFGAAPAASGWEFAVLTADGSRPHLVGRVTGH